MLALVLCIHLMSCEVGIKDWGNKLSLYLSLYPVIVVVAITVVIIITFIIVISILLLLIIIITITIIFLHVIIFIQSRQDNFKNKKGRCKNTETQNCVAFVFGSLVTEPTV